MQDFNLDLIDIKSTPFNNYEIYILFKGTWNISQNKPYTETENRSQ